MKTGETLRQAVAARRTKQALYAAAETRPPNNVRLGPLTITMMERSRWEGQSAFPSSQLLADEIEKVLNFAYWNGQFEYYLGHLCGSQSQRDSALAELRVAFYFRRNGFRISRWRPVGAGNREGEFSLRGPSGVDIFTEVKSPGWESELSEQEKKSGRSRQPKDLYCEARALDPSRAIVFAIDKAYGKFATNTPNLLIVVDDLFISLAHGTETFAHKALYKGGTGCFATDAYQQLGGVGMFWNHSNDKEGSWYEMKLFLNPFAIDSLPEDVSKGFHGYLPPPPEPKTSAIVIVRG